MSLKNRDAARHVAKAPRGIVKAIMHFKDRIEAAPKGRTLIAFSVVAAAVAGTIIARKLKKAVNKKRFLEKRDSHFVVDGELAKEHDGV
jgi:hypothetical protein